MLPIALPVLVLHVVLHSRMRGSEVKGPQALEVYTVILRDSLLAGIDFSQVSLTA